MKLIKTEIINTSTGKIQGYISDGIQIFKGIPFAEPPIGDLRFKPPVKKQPWEGVLEATEFGPYAYQGFTPLEMFVQEVKEDEDCLCLNIWTPSPDDKKRPVMVWIHGGAFVTGGGANLTYDGSPLTNRGDVVVVTINYRLGALGFLYIPGVTANAGMLDQIAALNWVQNNIEVFGGDSNNITVFGESAGGCSILTLLAMPAAKGLFHKAIVQSAPVLQPNPTLKSTNDLMNKFGLKAGDMMALQNLKVEEIIKAQDEVLAEALEARETEIMGFRPSIDIEGGTLPIHPLKALMKGEGKNIELLIGCNEEEGELFSKFNPIFEKLKRENLESEVANLLKSMNLESESSTLIQKYETARKEILPIKPMDLLNAIWTDYIFRISGINMAEAQILHNSNVYFYIFTWASPQYESSCHAVEIVYAFGTLDLIESETGLKWFYGSGPEAKIISEKMMDAWIAFARNGNPNNDNIPEWPSYETERRSTMLIGKEFKIVDAPFEKERVAWDGLLDY
ncbi:hypothetical protein LCGC14_0828460 [marine sediment metagenome]|uniref:Carboxylesterase type B domain-containing protein n=1 Tax=marine sediment metagenome TaxID=412755 RepID=A0A0F9Q1X1_9ZZZZ